MMTIFWGSLRDQSLGLGLLSFSIISLSLVKLGKGFEKSTLTIQNFDNFYPSFSSASAII